MRAYKFPALAKPSGITFEQHKLDVMSEGELMSQQMPFTFAKYQQRVGKDLSIRLMRVCKHHDVGKNHVKWQEACQKDYEDYLNWKKEHNGSFREYSDDEKNSAGKNIRVAGIRHELQSLWYALKINMPVVSQVAIAAHHGRLGYKFESRWKDEGLESFWKEFLRTSNDVSENCSLSEVADIQYEYAGPRGLLQLADHRASAKEDGEVVPDITQFKYEFPFASKRGVQKLIEKHWKEDLLLVRAPTGAGKTDASLLWASLQIMNHRAERMIIAMPTRFTSNALAVSVASSLSDTGLYHSSAWFNKFQDKVSNGEIDRNQALKIHEFARLLETPVTVCTIDHLLLSLTLTREDQQLITFNMANSCLVIDEADFYDEFTQLNILVLLEILKCWNVPILLMSASLPESVLYDYQKLGYEVNEIVEDTSDNERPRFRISDIREYEDLEQIEDILNLMIEKGNGIIYANTIDKAISYYEWFEKYNLVAERKVKFTIYHSHFTEPDKENKEDKIIQLLGKKAWENNEANGIVIMTQIGEMSINISADIMISELCPMDRLTQRAGRMCRFDKTKVGELFVLIPQKNGTVYPAPYGTLDKRTKSWTPIEPFNDTLKLLERKSYNAEDLNQMINRIYPSERKYSVKSMENAKLLKEYYMTNWLINPQQTVATDDTDTVFWKSRDIVMNETVFVNRPTSTHFLNHLDFQCWKIYNSIDLPMYFVSRGLKKNMIDIVDVFICEERQQIYVVREGFYNDEVGIQFPKEDDVFL